MIQDYLIGSDVFALGNENYFYPGTITKVNDDTFMIQFYNTDLGKNEINKDDVFPEGTGVNVVCNKSVNMVKAGIIDPVLVTKAALKNAVSVVNTIFSADCVISNIRIDASN